MRIALFGPALSEHVRAGPFALQPVEAAQELGGPILSGAAPGARALDSEHEHDQIESCHSRHRKPRSSRQLTARGIHACARGGSALVKPSRGHRRSLAPGQVFPAQQLRSGGNGSGRVLSGPFRASGARSGLSGVPRLTPAAAKATAPGCPRPGPFTRPSTIAWLEVHRAGERERRRPEKVARRRAARKLARAGQADGPGRKLNRGRRARPPPTFRGWGWVRPAWLRWNDGGPKRFPRPSAPTRLAPGAQSCARLSFRLEAIGVVFTNDEPASGKKHAVKP